MLIGMAKRYIPEQPFAVHVDGVHFVFSPDYIGTDGIRGYKTLPKGLSKAQKALFRSVTSDEAETTSKTVRAVDRG